MSTHDVVADFYRAEAERAHDIIDQLALILCNGGAPRVVNGGKQTFSQRLEVVLAGAKVCYSAVERLRLLILTTKAMQGGSA